MIPQYLGAYPSEDAAYAAVAQAMQERQQAYAAAQEAMMADARLAAAAAAAAMPVSYPVDQEAQGAQQAGAAAKGDTGSAWLQEGIEVVQAAQDAGQQVAGGD